MYLKIYLENCPNDNLVARWSGQGSVVPVDNENKSFF
jgi:hypothetical protein